MYQIPEELLKELQEILEQDYNVRLSDKAIEKTAKFLVSYFSILKKVEEQE